MKQFNWTPHIIAQEKSNKSAAQYCRDHGLSVTRFYHNRTIYNSKNSGHKSSFVSVIPKQTSIEPRKTGILLEIGCDGSVVISGRLPGLGSVKELFGAFS